MSAVHPASHATVPRGWASSAWMALITLVAIGAVLAMHGLGPHHAGLPTTSMAVPATAMAPMASDANAQDDGHSSHHQDTPTSTHELVAMCAVIILAALTLVMRSTITTRHTLWSLFRRPEHGSRPDPPVPRLALAFS
jgi:hypothetical protein